MKKNRWAMTTIAVSMVIFAAQVQAQQRSVDELFQEVVKTVEAGKSPGIAILSISKELDKIEFSGRDNYKGGLLLHYTNRRERAIEALEAFRVEFPSEETPEIIAALIMDYAFAGEVKKAETLDRYFRERYPDVKGMFQFSPFRMIDSINVALLSGYIRVGEYEKAVAKSKEMSRIREAENPENYYTTSMFRSGSIALIALGRYDEAIEFLAAEREKFEDGSIMAEYADLALAKAEYEKIAHEEGHEKAYAHLEGARDKFKNKYALRQYEYELDNASFVGKPMIELSVTDWLQRDESVDDLKGKVILIDLFTST